MVLHGLGLFFCQNFFIFLFRDQCLHLHPNNEKEVKIIQRWIQMEIPNVSSKGVFRQRSKMEFFAKNVSPKSSVIDFWQRCKYVSYVALQNSVKMGSLHKKWSFPWRISLVNVTKSAGICKFGHIYSKNPQWEGNFIFCAVVQHNLFC